MVNNRKKTIIMIITVLIAILSLSTATYAWFTNNVTAGASNKIETRTKDESLSLYVSSYGGNEFTKGNVCDIIQINNTDKEFMMPVSTDDLTNFVTKSSAGDDYELVIDEANIYHGRIYLKAESTNESVKNVSIYLDEIYDIFTKDNDDSLFLNALRIGLKMDGETIAILKASYDENDEGAREYNTIVDGVLAGDNKVLHYDGTGVSLVDDPAKMPADYYIDYGASVPLANIEVNKVYYLDVYMYLEGCDPDCSSSITLDGASVKLSFYAVAEGSNE